MLRFVGSVIFRDGGASRKKLSFRTNSALICSLLGTKPQNYVKLEIYAKF